MGTKSKLLGSGAIATGAGLIALTNSLGWALLIVVAAIAAAIFIKLRR